MPIRRGALWFSTVPRNAVLPSSSGNSKKNCSSTFLQNGGNHSPNDTVLIAETPCGQPSCRGTGKNINHWVQAFLHAHTDSQ